MARAVLILADLYPDPGSPPEAGGVPRLPALELWLARAVSQPLAPKGWRAWLREQLGAPLPAAADSPGHWLATPVHYVAGLDTLHLHGDGLLRLPLPEQLRLADEFERVFRGSGWALLPTDLRELLLRGPRLDADAPDPARFLGQSTREAQSRGVDAGALRGLQAEIEMWLHAAHFSGTRNGVNHKVNGMWLWGRAWAGPLDAAAARPAAVRGSPPAAQLYADDLAARTCAAAAGQWQSALPERWPDEAGGAADRFVVLNLDGAQLMAQLTGLEQRWIEPAVAAWRAGQFATLELVCADQRWTLSGAARWRFWRRRSHWLPELLAC